jgi:SAM-dependent methyltransferase
LTGTVGWVAVVVARTSPMKKRMRKETTDDRPDSSSSQEEVLVGDSPPPPMASSACDSKTTSSNDNGHRYGNFHNYYRFNPASNRTSFMHEILDCIIAKWKQTINSVSEPTTFRFLDVGCNEGDLTLEVAQLLSQRLTSSKLFATASGIKHYMEKVPILHVTGMDLDLLLIQRAQAKFQQLTDLHSAIQADFQVVDVLQDDIVAQVGDEISSASGCSDISDLTSFFSTTMWLHIHGGDEGLRRVLKQICSCTRYWILLEAQPSKCYASAAFRLRRMGLEPLDVSNQRLQLRPNVEEAIESILKDNSFERIPLENKGQVDDNGQSDIQKCFSKETKTPWNRSMRLYGRVSCNY